MLKLALIIATFVLSLPCWALQSGSYDKFVYARWGDYQVSQIRPFEYAIEQGKLSSITYSPQFSDVMRRVIPEVSELGPYYQEHLLGRDFSRALVNLVSEFGCLEYRFRHALPHTRECGAYVEDERVKEYFPFAGGYFLLQPLRVYQQGKAGAQHIGYSLYLKAGNKVKPSSIWYPVHQMGPAFGRAISSKQLVLTVSVEFEKLDAAGAPESRLFEKAKVLWLVLPKAADIAAQANELAAGRFAVKQAQVLVVEF